MLQRPITKLIDCKDDSILFRKNRGILKEVHIADLHFGAMDPEEQYNILYKQFYEVIKDVDFDILTIDGDTFDHKVMTNSNIVTVALRFIDLLYLLCVQKQATMVMIYGTNEHEAGQLNIFYKYISDGRADFRIITHAKFEYIKGAKILCLPEEYGKGKDYYHDLLFFSGLYDEVFMHGTYKNSIVGKNKIDLDSNREPVFGYESFQNCMGPIISGHVHSAACYDKYFYYCGSPYRWKYGEEQDKGFLFVIHDLDSGYHYTQFQKIECSRYETINIDDLIMGDPKEIIDKVKYMQSYGIENVRIQYTVDNMDTIAIIKNYFRSTKNVKIDDSKFNAVKKALKEDEQLFDKYKEYDYIMDPRLSEQEILCRYINQNKGYEYLTTDELIQLMSECD